MHALNDVRLNNFQLQRNPLKAIAVDDAKNVIATACAGPQSSIIFWDASSGLPVGMIESPHASGTAALAFTPDSRYLATLSVPSASTTAGETGVQELGVWDCSSILFSLGLPCGDYKAPHNSDPSLDSVPVPTLCCTAGVRSSDEQKHVSISRHALPEVLTPGKAEAIRDGAVLDCAFELCTGGVQSVVFWAVTRCIVKDTDPAATAQLARTARAAAGGIAKAVYATKSLWAIACDVPRVPAGASHGSSLGGRHLSQTAYIPGYHADHLSTIDVAAAESKALDAGLEGTLAGSSPLARSPSRSGSPRRALNSRGGAVGGSGTTSGSPSKKGLQDPLGTVMLKAPTGASATAVTGTSDGMLLLWQNAFHSSDAEAAFARGVLAGPGSGFASVAAVVARKSCLKAVKLTAPEILVISTDGPEKKSPEAYRINTVRSSPCGSRVVIGTEDGSIRIYDLNMRLIAWFEDLQAGPITAMDFVPGTTAADLAAVSIFPQPGLPLKKSLATVPDLVLVTRRCMMLSLPLAAFDTTSLTDEARKGSVLLEGPDAPVTGLAAYPHAPKLAVVVASGVLQVWDTHTKALLVLRELVQPPDLEAYRKGRKQETRYYHPTSLAVDPLGRFVAVGTAEGYILVLSPDDLTDVQVPISPPEYPRAGHAVTRLVFSPDGYHMAAADTARHVSLFRFVRSTSRRLAQGVAQATAAQRLVSRHPWETVLPESDRFEQVIVDAWSYIGRVRGHSQPITGLSFSHIPPEARSMPKPGSGMACVPGFESTSFWDASTDEDAVVAGRHLQHGLAHLVSVGADRNVCLYDVGGASVTGGVPVRLSRIRSRIESGSARPTCAFWLPPRTSCPALGTDYAASPTGMSLVVASDAYKLKIWDCSGVPSPARTALAPTFGGSITHAALLCSSASTTPDGSTENKKEEESTFGGAYAFAYATDDRIVGIARLPLDGNPHGYMGVVGHTGPVAALAASANGQQVYTAGMESEGPAAEGFVSVDALLKSGSGSVCIWRVDEAAVHAATAVGGTGVTPFLSLLEGGGTGKQYSDICDLFSYAQIRAQGESSTAPRKAGVDLPVTELSAVMRGLGYFPTAEAAEAMVAEAKASMAESGAEAQDMVDLQTLIRLFVNHRPVHPPAAADVKRALAVIAASREAQNDVDETTGGIRWGGLARILASHAERLGTEELTACITGLLGVDTGGHHASAVQPLLDDEDVLTQEDVADKLLGLKV